MGFSGVVKPERFTVDFKSDKIIVYDKIFYKTYKVNIDVFRFPVYLEIGQLMVKRDYQL